MIIVGSARSCYNAPKKGDQSGKEVSTQNFYTNSPYWLGYEPISDKLGEQLAQNMKDACDNNHIGYSQPYRMSGRQAFIKYGSIKGIKEDCAVDCSSLVNLCIFACGYGYNLPNFNTATEPQVLEKSGLFKKKIVKVASDIKKVGTILVTPVKGHTLIVVDGDFNKTVTSATNLKSNEEIVKEVIQGKWGNGNARKSKLTKAGYDYETIRAMVNKELKKK